MKNRIRKNRLTAILLTLCLLLSAATGVLAEENHIWQKGDSGKTVLQIETRLHELEYLEREPGEIFDEETEKALAWFQRDHDLLETGMADRVTLELLESATSKARQADAWKWAEDIAEYEDGLAWLMPNAPGGVMATSAPALSFESAMAAGGAWEYDVDWNTE